ncbi:hypothetical protein DL767_001094 [Monosporascus sp. MG133]|nr:hypothetical protein DL767_001094 [Monosporascus sp. MG133]
MRFATLSTLLCGCHALFAPAVGRDEPRGLHERYVTLSGIETTCFSFMSTYLVPAGGEPTSGITAPYVQSGGRFLGADKPLSVDPGVPYIDITSFAGGSISTTFTTIGGILAWDNETFFNGAAEFCQASNGTVYAHFTGAGGPEDCVPIDLVVYMAQQCQNGVIVPMTSLPESSPTGPNSEMPYVTTTRRYTGTVVTTTTEGRIVIVETPFSYVTRTTRSTGATSFTTTQYPGDQDGTGTVIVGLPYDYTTTYTVHTGAVPTATTLYPNKPDGTATVIVGTPSGYVPTKTQRYTGTAATTSTALRSGGTEPTAVVIWYGYEFLPLNYVAMYLVMAYANTFAQRVGSSCFIDTPYAYTTVTSGYDGTARATTTLYPSGTAETATVVVQTPAAYATTTEAYDGAAVTTTTVPPSGTLPGTVIVLTPTASFGGFVTVTELYTGTATSRTTIPPSGTVPGTVVLLTPGSGNYATRTQVYTGTGTTTTTIPPAGTVPGTVLVLRPSSGSYVTTTEPYTGRERTTTTIPPSGTALGTVVVLTPNGENYVTVTRPYGETQATTTTVPPSGTAPGTVIIFTPTGARYVTTTEGYTGVSTTTTTVPPSGSAPGTVIILGPESYVTTTRPFTGAAITTTTVPPSGTTPGTVIILRPENYVTTTSPYNGDTTTTTTVSPNGEAPGTVIIYTPYAYVTTTEAYTGDIITTTTASPSGASPGTVRILTPYPYATVTQAYTGTAITTTTVSRNGTVAGTVVIQTPGPYITTTTGYGGLAGTTTVVEPSGTQPGTVIVKTPIPRFACAKEGYLIQSVGLATFDLQSGIRTPIKDPVVPGSTFLNAIGYHVGDNFLYATVSNPPATLIRIGSDGQYETVTNVTELVTANGNLNVGDVDENLQYWASANGNFWVQIDLDPTKATYGQVVDSGKTNTVGVNELTPTVFDWAYVPNTSGNNLWALGRLVGNTAVRLMSFDRDTHIWTDSTLFGDVAGTNSFGGVFAGEEGYLYGIENTSGQIWRFPVPGPNLPAGRVRSRVVNSGASTLNDGARCFNAPRILPEEAQG